MNGCSHPPPPHPTPHPPPNPPPPPPHPPPQLYDSEMDGCDVSQSTVRVTQWLSYGDAPGHVNLSGQRILIVDEVRPRG
jgi:hypothetical protein